VWLPIYWVACRFEEADLVRRYGQNYEEYQKQVGMFFPKIGGTRD
jgi:protein-S-isoprenylcysteine O-methyltransferase Ste14